MALSLKPIEIVERNEFPLLVKANHWERVFLRDIAEVQNGCAFKSKYFTHDKGIPLIRIRDITKKKTEHFYDGSYEKEYIVKNGDILIGMDGDFRAAKWQGKIGLLNQRVCRVVLTSNYFIPEFFFYCLNPYLSAINAETSSVTVKHLSARTVEQIPLPLPPLNEQHRIVAKIEELFTELDKGVESLTTAREQLKVYRQALLKYAFEGKLTEKWRAEHGDQLESADQLLARIKQEREQHYQLQLAEWEQAVEKWIVKGKEGKKPAKPRKLKELPEITQKEAEKLPELPDNWIWIKVDKIHNHEPNAIKAGPFGSALKKASYVSSGYKIYGQEQVISGDWQFGDYFINEGKYAELENCKVAPNDILISLVGTVGKVLILSDGIQEGVINPRASKNAPFCLIFLPVFWHFRNWLKLA